MEQDVEDGEENSESKSEKSRSLNKSSKRKRDLLSDLQIWGWHSKRKGAKKGKTDKDLTVDDAFKRIIPRHLLYLFTKCVYTYYILCFPEQIRRVKKSQIRISILICMIYLLSRHQ